MKKLIKITLALATALVLLMSMVGCFFGEIADYGKCTVVLSAGGEVAEYTVPLDKLGEGEGAIAALDYLVSEGKITYKAEDGGYGAYLTEVLAADGSVTVKQATALGRYVGIYTSVERDFDTSSYATTVSYKDVPLTSSGVGISGMSLDDGAIIYITEISY